MRFKRGKRQRFQRRVKRTTRPHWLHSVESVPAGTHLDSDDEAMKQTKRKEVSAEVGEVGDEPIHLATVDWQCGKWSGVPGKYSREHVWVLPGGLTLKATDPIAPTAYRDRARLDLLNAFVATVASGHLLAWLN